MLEVFPPSEETGICYLKCTDNNRNRCNESHVIEENRRNKPNQSQQLQTVGPEGKPSFLSIFGGECRFEDV